MAYSVLVSKPAEEDLDGAVGYIAETLCAPSAAAALLDDFESALRLLADNPSLFGVDLPVSEAVGRQVRRCPVRRYGAYYVVDNDEGSVYVVAFAHGRRDAAAIVRGRLA